MSAQAPATSTTAAAATAATAGSATKSATKSAIKTATPAELQQGATDALVDYWIDHFKNRSDTASQSLAKWLLTPAILRAVLGLRGDVCELMFHAMYTRARARVYKALGAQIQEFFEAAVSYLGYGMDQKLAELGKLGRGGAGTAILDAMHEALVLFCCGLKIMGFVQEDLDSAVAETHSRRKAAAVGARRAEPELTLSKHDIVREFLLHVVGYTFRNSWPAVLPKLTQLDPSIITRLFSHQLPPPHRISIWELILRDRPRQPRHAANGSQGDDDVEEEGDGKKHKRPVPKALAVLSLLRFFDGHVNIFTRLPSGECILDLVQAHSLAHPSFWQVVDWLRAARHDPRGMAGAADAAIAADAASSASGASLDDGYSTKDCQEGPHGLCGRASANKAYPFSTSLRKLEGTFLNRRAAERRSAANSDAMGMCHMCGATAAELRERRCQRAGPDYTEPLSPALLRCTSCRSAAYCTKACQAADWVLGHKAVCTSITRGT